MIRFVALLTLLVVPAHAAPTPVQITSPYDLDQPLPLAAVGLALSAGLFVQLAPQPHQHSWLAPFDETRSFDNDWHQRSNLDVSLSVAVPTLVAAGALLSDSQHTELWADGLVWLQTIGIIYGTVNSFKYAVGRDRPFVPTASGELLDDDAHRSFLSGHTAMAVGAMMASLRILRDRQARAEAQGQPVHPERLWTASVLVLTVGTVLASQTAFGRVMAGKHHTSDVLAGAAVGALVGWYVPGWFAADSNNHAAVVPTTSGATLTWSAVW